MLGAERRRATPDGPRRAQCPDCSAEMLAKTGSVVVWHWAHRVRPLDCQAAHEGEWHLAWKALALDGTQEVAHPSGKRRADVLAPGGFAVEFQASPLTAAEVQAREADWDNKLVWVFDAREAFQKGSLKVLGEGTQRGIFWFKAPERIKAARCPTYYDLGDGNLIQVGELRREKASLKGRGWFVSQTSVVSGVLRGGVIPPSPSVYVPKKARGLQNLSRPSGWLDLRHVSSRGAEYVQIYFEGNPELVEEFEVQSGNYYQADWLTQGSWLMYLTTWDRQGGSFLEKMFYPNVRWSLPAYEADRLPSQQGATS